MTHSITKIPKVRAAARVVGNTAPVRTGVGKRSHTLTFYPTLSEPQVFFLVRNTNQSTKDYMCDKCCAGCKGEMGEGGGVGGLGGGGGEGSYQLSVQKGRWGGGAKQLVQVRLSMLPYRSNMVPGVSQSLKSTRLEHCRNLLSATLGQRKHLPFNTIIIGNADIIN